MEAKVTVMRHTRWKSLAELAAVETGKVRSEDLRCFMENKDFHRKSTGEY